MGGIVDTFLLYQRLRVSLNNFFKEGGYLEDIIRTKN